MNILIADDLAAIRRRVREILADTLEGAHFYEAATAGEVMSRLAGAPFALVLLDINMPGRSGLDALRDVKNAYPDLPVIMVSVQPADQYAARCMQAGATAYINKDSVPEELPQAVAKVLGIGHPDRCSH